MTPYFVLKLATTDISVFRSVIESEVLKFDFSNTNKVTLELLIATPELGYAISRSFNFLVKDPLTIYTETEFLHKYEGQNISDARKRFSLNKTFLEQRGFLQHDSVEKNLKENQEFVNDTLTDFIPEARV